MQEHDDLLADAARQLLQGECTPARVRAIEAGDSPRALWDALEQAGFADALVPEAAGGAGLALAQLFDVWALCGAQALPVPLGETMLARALLAGAGVAHPAGSIALAEGRLQADGSLHCTPVCLGAVADSVLVQHAQGWSLLPVAQARPEKAAFCLDVNLRWPAAQVRTLEWDLPQGLDLRTLQACLMAAQLAGALMDVFQRTLQYANERQQFGRPIGKFQAIQHQLAVMSEQVFAARMAARLGCAGEGVFPDRLRVAVAKARCSQAALAVAEAAHAIHGAIGFTEEYDLQLLTRRLHAWRQTAGTESYWHGVAGAALVHGHAGSTLDLIRSTTDITA
ncbi:Acyl-CoA dehydrogenase, short-chain specific [Delftia tsuruhatensis]|uniref:acyl-CoA dehydrogenase family protein n=1 Tax=Delftia tsuruhatensis TaxID=180282 RepID=UPI001E7D5E2E|nr:acyl-CoA dehydrogenase family protein [Delftia tsuruhatensis]CAB5680752.1 Acyl-CoA dehydrogenase, short-chain specific [Delftia tsuruhatensis]CAC9675596.1 Acyl-CoA dehydrogenase, short-chain specific [Delftia tsuruhatensis]